MQAAGHLRAFFERWERLEADKQAISDDLKELFAEMKGVGFDTKAARAVFREKLADEDQAKREARDEFEAICDLYRAALEKPRAHPAPARTREIIEEFESAVDLNDSGTAPRAAADESAQLFPVSVAGIEYDTARTAPAEGAHTETSAPILNAREALVNDEPSPGAGPQAEAPLAGTGTGTLAGREGRYEGEAASAGLPTNSIPQAVSPPQNTAVKTGEEVPSASPVALSDDDVPAFLKPAKPLRPHCLRPELCAGMGWRHCYQCSKAANLNEAAA